TRPREVNAVPWQTAAVMLGEHFPRITDAVLSRTSRIAGTQSVAHPPDVMVSGGAQSAPESNHSDDVPGESDAGTLESVLEPHARKMERSGLRMAFVEGLLEPGAQLELGEVAMRWAGMPNKHERALTLEVLRALESAGYLEASGDETWTVSGKR
ncbi:MAG: hypothetical protein ACRENA_13695, partial [Vulcanimicrobiaceae bacterium]